MGARRSFRKIIDVATTRAGWMNTQTFQSDCNCVLESLLAELSLDEVVAAVDRQGFRAAEEYRRAATVLQEVARERRVARRQARDGES